MKELTKFIKVETNRYYNSQVDMVFNRTMGYYNYMTADEVDAHMDNVSEFINSVRYRELLIKRLVYRLTRSSTSGITNPIVNKGDKNMSNKAICRILSGLFGFMGLFIVYAIVPVGVVYLTFCVFALGMLSMFMFMCAKLD
jgi:hypothetical protein